MTYLEQLKQVVADAFKDASDKSTIDKMVAINSLIDNATKENAELMDKNKDLIAAYKDAVMHPAIGKESTADDPTRVETPAKAPDLCAIISQTLKK